MAEGQPVDVQNMSDEDFLNADTSTLVEALVEAAPAVEEGNDSEIVPDTEAEAAAKAEGNDDDTKAAEGEEGQGDANPDGEKDAQGNPLPAKTEEQSGKEAPKDGKAEGAVPAPGSKEGETTPAVEAEPVDYEATYKEIFKPFKANGKQIEVKNIDEARQLMQMGANYTRKMQDIQPHRKVLTMLQNADLMDEGKLDLLIAVSKKDPEAIKRIIKDAGIDPLDLDTTTEPTYVEGSHQVTDNEVSFNSAIEDLVSNEGGTETLQLVRNTWDQASKDALWAEPTLLEAIRVQKQSGVYDLISTEVNRLQVLGQIPPNTPFIRAYQMVGDHLAKSGVTVPEVDKDPGKEPGGKTADVPNPTPVATKAKIPVPKVENSDRASAASPSRNSVKPAKTLVNPLAMSDEEFMATANFQGRI